MVHNKNKHYTTKLYNEKENTNERICAYSTRGGKNLSTSHIENMCFVEIGIEQEK